MTADVDPPARAPHLVLDDVVRGWRGRPVLKGASLRVYPGEVVWLGGANGAGKTTLLRVAASILLPEAGSVRLAGIDPAKDRQAYQSRLGFLTAGDRGLYARLSAAQNLEFWARISFVADRRRAVAIAIEQFGLQDLAHRRVDRISTGQRHRVRLAMTFLHEPSVVLLDEPATSLDDAGLALLQQALDRLTRRGGAALWCSPTGQGDFLCSDRHLRLIDGKVTEV